MAIIVLDEERFTDAAKETMEHMIYYVDESDPVTLLSERCAIIVRLINGGARVFLPKEMIDGIGDVPLGLALECRSSVQAYDGIYPPAVFKMVTLVKDKRIVLQNPLVWYNR